jgi:diguanylate cyclase (GGDEF)-like protein
MTEPKKYEDILDRIFFITERIVVFDGLEDVFEHIVRTAVTLTQAEAATIRVFDFKTGKLQIIKGYGLSKGFLSQPAIRIGEGITGNVVLTGKPYLTEDVTKEPICVHKEMAKLEGIRALMSVPLKTKDNGIGCITVYRKTKKPFAEHDLLLLGIFAAQATEVLEKTKLVEELRSQATYDSLTGIYNKGAFLKELDLELKLALRHVFETSIIFIDIDNFKDFNDTHGHLLGDKLLCDFIQILKHHCRRTDILGRFGGEEFIVIAPHTDKNKALKFAEKLRLAASKHKFTGRTGDVYITFSAGIASFPADAIDVAELIKKADEAMYCSKKAGKNRVTAWSDKIKKQ